jgi:hypothetical protein
MPHTPDLPDAWSAAIQRLFNAARSSGNIVYGPWSVEHVPHCVIVPNRTGYNGGAPGIDYTDASEGWKVKDLNGTTIVVVTNKALAELIASLPDLCDPALRPGFGGHVECGITGRAKSIPTSGTSDPQKAFDTGYRQGYDEGVADGEEAACGDSGVA